MTRQKREKTTYNIEVLQAAEWPTANKAPKEGEENESIGSV